MVRLLGMNEAAADLLEAVQMHRRWLRSLGESGTRLEVAKVDFRAVSANLVKATLDEADFSSADMRYARLTSAAIFDTVFEGADLRGADLRNMNLARAATWFGANLGGAKTDPKYNDRRSSARWFRGATISSGAHMVHLDAARRTPLCCGMGSRRDAAATDRFAAVVEALVEEGLIELLGADVSERRRWLDCELASLAELRLGDEAHPFAIDEARREAWSVQASEGDIPSLKARGGECDFWLVVRGERVGTVALAPHWADDRGVHLSSLYVLPEHRGHRYARALLDALTASLGERGLRLRLETHWSWRSALRFYLRNGFWVRMWKRELDLYRDAGTPSPTIAIGEGKATLALEVDGEPVVVVRAARDGERLTVFDVVGRADPRVEPWSWDADTTLAVALAANGWPLLKDPIAWARSWQGDGGHPQGLAHRIIVWEAYDRHRGWRVDTPRIPGLPYATWEELEADWEASRARFEAELERRANVGEGKLARVLPTS